MKSDVRILATAGVALAALITHETVTAAGAHAQSNPTLYVWCVLNDNRQDTAYYSSVFSSPYSDIYGHAVPFTNFLQARYGSSGALAHCFSEEVQSNAQNAKAYDMSRGIFANAVDTGWRP